MPQLQGEIPGGELPKTGLDPVLPANVLVVDDQASNRELARQILVEEGYEVQLASSGQDALALWEHKHADCVLLDIRMPGLDGFEVCRQLRARPRGAAIPVLFLTALREVDALERALGMGAVDFLTKPIKPAELLLRVATALKLSRLGTERDELYALLRHQRDDLLRLSLQRERLSTFLVHDLKNSAYGIRLAAELLLVDGGSSPRTQEVAQRISQESDKLMGMIQNLLDISKADEQHLVLSCMEVELGPLLEEIYSALSLQAKMRDLELRAEVQGRLWADREILRRLLGNLLDNALRHAPRSSVISVEAARRDRGLELRVRDQGPGVPPELRESIFERFVQGGEPKGRVSYGLGLAFCKLAVEAHGGRIWIEDGNPGTVFCIWWPDLTPCEPAAPRAPSPEPRPEPAS